MDKGLSNFQIDDFFKNEENEDLKKTYSIDSITRYIDFYEIIKRRNSDIHLQYLTLTKKMNHAFTGGVLWIFTQK